MIRTIVAAVDYVASLTSSEHIYIWMDSNLISVDEDDPSSQWSLQVPIGLRETVRYTVSCIRHIPRGAYLAEEPVLLFGTTTHPLDLPAIG